MEYLSSDKIAIIDLASSEIIEEELEEDFVKERIGGAGITSVLYERFKDEDPIVLGSGLLTGTLVPASALAVMTARSPLTGKVCHAPLTLDAGLELKYSGFDYLVIKGNSEKPIFLWIHDGIADIQDADEVWGKDVWASTDYVREVMGDDMIQVLGIGKAGESGSDIAQVCINYWASGDRMGFGNLFGKKNLKLIAIRGMGLLEIAEPEEFLESCSGLLSTVKAGPLAGKKGIAHMAVALSEEDIGGWIEPLIHRHSACFNTPFATNTFVFLDEDPGLLKETGVENPGFLLTDIQGLSGFKKLGLSASDACSVLMDCAKYGIDAAAVAELSEKAGTTDPGAIKNSFSELKGPVDSAGNSVFSPWAPSGNQNAEEWERRQAVAYIFGIHPIFALLSPEPGEEKLLELSSLGTELELNSETLDKVVAEITT
jgi:aldehyde:ferredoxin oxidoreductase